MDVRNENEIDWWKWIWKTREALIAIRSADIDAAIEKNTTAGDFKEEAASTDF
jgi:hypothetical protein